MKVSIELKNFTELLPLQKEETLDTGEKILLFPLGCKEENLLDKLRARKYIESISSKMKNNEIKPEKLGPTSDDAPRYNMRAYCQLQVWKGLTGSTPLTGDGERRRRG